MTKQNKNYSCCVIGHRTIDDDVKMLSDKCFDGIVYLNDIDETKVKLTYVLRNKKLVEESDFCMIYYRKIICCPHIMECKEKVEQKLHMNMLAIKKRNY